MLIAFNGEKTEKLMNIYYLSMLVRNDSGVLTRITGLIARRGYNIDSLSVCTTEDSSLSRMTISLTASEKDILQLRRQLSKQVDVLCITGIGEKEVLRELLIVKLAIHAEKRSQIIEICTIYGAKTIDLTQEAMVLELTGDPDKIDAFIALLLPYNVIELARTGVTCLHRGATAIKDFIEKS